MSSDDVGVVLPADSEGRRSSSALGRAVVADALRGVDSDGAFEADREPDWRRGYLTHFRRLIQSGVASRQAALTIADDGLRAVHRRMRFRRIGGDEVGGEVPLEPANVDVSGPPLTTVEIRGSGELESGFSLPVRGQQLRGDALSRQLDCWADAGVLEPSAAERIRIVMAHPEWLRLDGHTIVVLGAAAEMAPLPHLLRWGARVAAIDLPRPELWRVVHAAARDGAGTLLLPLGADRAGAADTHGIPTHSGLDLLVDSVVADEWIRRLEGRLVLGNYVYADGAANVRLSAAVDAMILRLQEVRPDIALAWLATPTDVFAVPPEAVEHAQRAYESRSTVARLVGGPVRAMSGGRLLQRQYRPVEEPAIHDALVAQQGPNYALAKRLQRWRATVARDAGSTVSMNVAPPTRTRSVLKNRGLAAAYAQAHRFGVEVFEPTTASTLMAGILVADLHTDGGPLHDQPWQDEAYAAVHGGLWRAPYRPRSALGLAAALGYRAARG